MGTELDAGPKYALNQLHSALSKPSCLKEVNYIYLWQHFYDILISCLQATMALERLHDLSHIERLQPSNDLVGFTPT